VRLSLRSKLALFQVGIYFSVGTLAFVVGHTTSFGLLTTIPAAFIGWWLASVCGRRVAAGANARLMKAVASEDTDLALARMEDVRGLYAGYPKALAQLSVNEGVLLAGAGRYADAIRVLEAARESTLAVGWRPWVLTSMAWCLANTGEAARGLSLVREAGELARANPSEALGDEFEASRLGTLGACLVGMEEYAEAHEVLERALALGGKAKQAARQVFLGEALRGLGRPDDARDAFERALQEEPEGQLSARAKKALESLLAYR